MHREAKCYCYAAGPAFGEISEKRVICTAADLEKF